MTTVSDVLHFIDTLAPRGIMEGWDNCGLLCGCGSKEVRTILVALDPFEAVAQEAIREQADLIVTHHPLIFRPQKSVTDETSVGRTLMMLIQNGISAINAHTNLDCAKGGVNDVLAQKLGLTDVTILNPTGVDANGNAFGLLRAGNAPEQPLEQFLGFIKKALGCPGLRYVSADRPVRRVAVGGGACADEFEEAYRHGCDTLVTSDAKYNQFWDAQDLGINLIDAGHFYTENPVCEYLHARLQEEFPEIRVMISRDHQDCMKFF